MMRVLLFVCFLLLVQSVRAALRDWPERMRDVLARRADGGALLFDATVAAFAICWALALAFSEGWL